MLLLTKILGACLVAVAGAHIGIRALLYLSVAAGAGFASYATNKALFRRVAFSFSTLTTWENAVVITFLILTLIPLITIGYFGRLFILRIKVDETMNVLVNRVLGAGFALAIYVCVLVIV